VSVSAGGTYHTQSSPMCIFQYMPLNNLLDYACNLHVHILVYGL